MRLICSSSACARAFSDGLTQLEWLERVARETCADGVALDVAHVPRFDTEYLAQIRKVGVDLGLEMYAVEVPALFAAVAAGDTSGIDLAVACGASILVTHAAQPGPVPPESFVREVAAAKAAARAAKAANVTIAVEPHAGTLGATLDGVRHLLKDADSAWLRYAIPAAGRDTLGPRERAVAVTATLADDPAGAGRRAADLRRPLIVGAGGEAAPDDEFAALAAWLEDVRRSTAVAVSIAK